MGAPARASLFSTVPARDYLQFWQAGRFQPQRVARFLGLNKVELAQLAAVAPASVRFDDKAPRMLRERLMDIAATCELVAQAFEGNTTKTALWFMTANPTLGNLSPRDLLQRGEHAVLQRHVLEAAGAAALTPQPQPPPEAESMFHTIPPGRALLDARRDEIAHLCQRYAVRSLAVFDSVLHADFDPDHSDIDLVARFAHSTECSPERQYFDFKAELEQLLKCRLIIHTQTVLYDAGV